MQNINKNRCRICLGNQNLADMFVNKVSERITYCTTVQVSPEDPFPSKICKKCGFYLNVAYVFRTVCEWTDLKLQQELRQANSINTAINNTQQALCNKFSYVENTKNPNNKHLLELLLKREFLETYEFFTFHNKEEVELEVSKNNVYDKQRLIEKDINYLCNKFFNEEIETMNEGETVQMHQNSDPLNDSITSPKEDADFGKESSFVMKKNTITMNFNKETARIHDKHTCLFNEDSLGAEEGLVADISLLQSEDILENGINNEEHNFISESNKIKNEEHLNVDEEKTVLNIGEHKEIDADYPLDETTNNNEVNFINEKTAIEQHILEEENVVVDDGLIYGCETHQDIYDKSMYGKVCLNTEDPLLHNVTSQATLLENEETDLGNLEANLKSCFCVENKPEKPSNEKHITLSNISLHDFENFEKEQLNNDLSNSITNQNNDVGSHRNGKLNNINLPKMGQSENRVGRHIAKKNAGQPPKRYSPTPEAAKLASLTQKHQTSKDDLSTASNLIKVDEAEDKLEKKTELKDVDGLLDQEYILESDLSMPEPIFEETIVTDGFYFANDDEELLEVNCGDQENESNAKMKNQVKRRTKNGSTKLKKKVNIFMDQTVMSTVRPKRNKYSIKKQANKTKLQNHLHQNVNGVEVSEDCDYISETEGNNFYNPDDDDNHENAQKSHNSTKGKFSNRKIKKRKGTTCKLCNKSFPFPSHLQRHLTAHIGIKRFVCKYCNKEFLHRYNLSVHMRSHTGNFPLKCNICNRGFVSSSVLERHKRSHTGETPFQCQYCLQLFSHASSLNMHEKMHLNRPSFPCDVCYKVFSYKSSLNAHKKGHSGFKPHSCSVCHKRFTRRTSVLRHMSCHSEVKKFKCRTCDEVLSSQSNLVKHRKIHQGLCS